MRVSFLTALVVFAPFSLCANPASAGAFDTLFGTRHPHEGRWCAYIVDLIISHKKIAAKRLHTLTVVGQVLMAQLAMPIRRELGELGHNHSTSFDHRRRPETLRTAMATAFFCPTRITSRLPRVTPV